MRRDGKAHPVQRDIVDRCLLNRRWKFARLASLGAIRGDEELADLQIIAIGFDKRDRRVIDVHAAALGLAQQRVAIS